MAEPSHLFFAHGHHYYGGLSYRRGRDGGGGHIPDARPHGPDKARRLGPWTTRVMGVSSLRRGRSVGGPPTRSRSARGVRGGGNARIGRIARKVRIARIARVGWCRRRIPGGSTFYTAINGGLRYLRCRASPMNPAVGHLSIQEVNPVLWHVQGRLGRGPGRQLAGHPLVTATLGSHSRHPPKPPQAGDS